MSWWTLSAPQPKLWHRRNIRNISYTIALSVIDAERKYWRNAGPIISPPEGAWAALGFLESSKILITKLIINQYIEACIVTNYLQFVLKL